MRDTVTVELSRDEAEIARQGCVNQCTYPGGDAKSLIAERAFRKLRAAIQKLDATEEDG